MCPTQVYADNNFDIVMVQCEACLRWLHAECDGIDQEMYNLMSSMSDVPYFCPDCRTGDASVRWGDGGVQCCVGTLSPKINSEKREGEGGLLNGSALSRSKSAPARSALPCSPVMLPVLSCRSCCSSDSRTPNGKGCRRSSSPTLNLRAATSRAGSSEGRRLPR